VVALVGAAAVFASGSAWATAAPKPTTVTVGVGQTCSGKGGQLCGFVSPVGEYNSQSALTVIYTAAATHCSNVAVQLFVDGKHAATTGFVPASGSASATVPWPNDGEPHTLGIEGEGELGGCNVAGLGNWGGTLTISYTPAPLECDRLRLSASFRHWKTDETTIDYTVFGIKRKCGPVTVTIDGDRKTFGADHPTISGVDDLPGRFCQRTAFARQSGADTGGPIGQAAVGKVLYARDMTGPDGEKLREGDDLCFEETHRDIDANDAGAAMKDAELHVGTDGVAYLSLTNFGNPHEVLYAPAAKVNVAATSIDAARIVIAIGHTHVDITPPTQQNNVPGFGVFTELAGVQPNGTEDPCKSPEASGNHFDIVGFETSFNTNTETIFSCPVDLAGDFNLEVDVTFDKGLYGDGSIWAENISVHGGITLNFSDPGRTSLLSAAGDIKLTG